MTQAERDEIRALVLSFSTKISDLPEVEALQDGDYVVVVQNDGSKKHSKKATLESLLELIKIYYPDHNGAKYQGVAHPNDNIVNLPIGTDGFWFAIDAGVYTNYGGIVVGNSPKTLLYNAETHEWTSEDLWGDINGTVGFRLIDSSIENSLETFRIPVIQSRPYIISANARPSGSFAVLNIYEYDYTGELIGSIGYHVPEHSFTPREDTAYIKIGLGYNSSNPIAVELSEVRVTSSIKTLIEGLTDFVVDVLQGEYATHFGNIEDNINTILDRVGANEVNIATLQQGVSDLGTGLDSLSSRTGIIAGDVAQLVIDTSGISTRLENTEQDVHELSITAGGLDERITNNQNDIFSLSTRADGLEVEVQNANRDITSLQITAEGLDARVSNAQGDVDELEITAEGLRQRVSTAEGDIHTLESTATTLESNIGAVDGRVSTLSQTVERIDAKVENNEGEIAGLAVEAHRIDLYAQSVNTNLGNYEAYANGVMAGLQEQLDGAIDTYFYDYMPVHVDATGAPDSQVPLIEVTVGGVTIPCEPYASWYAADEGGTAQEVNTERLKHLGDVFYDNKSGYAFRFSNTGTSDSPVFAWAVITDSAVIRALADAARAQDTADHKRRVFVYSSSYPTPYAPYDIGDLWVKPVTVGTGASAQSTTELYRCKTAREKTTNTFPFNPAVNTDTTSSGCDWEIADGYGTIVNKANLEILSDAIIGSVSQTTFDYENGIITSQCSSTIRQTANEIKLAISNGAIDTAVATNGKINKPLLDTGIDITNGNIVLTANHIALKNQNNQTALELITVGSGQDTKVLIDVGSLNVSGIFTTSAWSTQENALHGYSDTAAGNAYTNAVAQAATDAASYITTNVSPLITNAQTTADNAATAAGNAQTTANNAATAAGNAQTAVNGMAYLATALANGTTAIGGGLVLSSLIGVGGNTGTDDAWELWGGIRALSSGEANTGIAAWYGGDAVDCTTISGWGSMSAAQKEQAWSTYRYARSLFRHDGSGYLASGEIAWGKNGDIVLHGVGIETPVISGGSIGSTTEVTDGTTTFTVADLIELKSWFQKDTYTDGTGTHTYLRLVCSSGTIEGLAADGFISAGGISPGGGGSGIDLDAMWTSLTTTSDAHGTDKIHTGHLPALSVGTGLTASYTQTSATSTTLNLALDADLSAIAGLSGTSGLLKKTAANTWTLDTSAYITGITSTMVTTALGYTPVNKAGDTMTGDLSVPHLNITNTGGSDEITFARDNYNYIRAKTSGGRIAFITDGKTMVGASADFAIGPGWASVNNGVTAPSYNFYVNGTLNATTIYQNGTTLANTYLALAGGDMTGTLGIYRQTISWNSIYNGDGKLRYLNSTDPAATGAPGTWWAAVSMVGLYGFQIAVPSTVGNVYKVRQIGSAATWTDWVTLYHSGNSNLSTVNWTCATLSASNVFLSNVQPITFTGAGTGTYNKSVIYCSTSGWTLEAPLVSDSATAAKVPIKLGWRGGAAGLYIDALANVGIGTSSPGYKFHVSGTTTASVDNLCVFENTADFVWTNAFSCYAPNLSAGNNTGFGVGKAASHGNSAALQYHHVGTSNNGNCAGIGLYGKDYILSCFYSGNVTIGNGTTDGGYPLYVKDNISNHDVPLAVKSNVADMCFIKVTEKGGSSGWIGYYRTYGLSYYDGDYRRVYHSGNANSLSNTVSNSWSSYHLLANRMAARFIDAGLNSIVSDHNLYVGYGAATWTNSIYFYISTGTADTDTVTGRTMAMCINAARNVTIGTSDLASTSYKLYVHGSSYFSNTTNHNGDIILTSATGRIYRNQSGTNPILTCWNGSYGDGASLSYNSSYGMYFSDKLGIANSTPEFMLDIYSSSTGPFRIITATGVWNYLRFVNKNNSTNLWDVGTVDGTGTFIGQSGAFEIRDGLSSWSGISIRHATSAYGKLVVTVPDGECSIGYWSTSANPRSGFPIWTVGYTADTNKTFGWYYCGGTASGTYGWRMLLGTDGHLSIGGAAYSSTYTLNATGAGYFSTSLTLGTSLSVGTTLSVAQTIRAGDGYSIAVGTPGGAGANNKTHYLSAGPGYSANSGRYGLKVLVCDQSDAQTGLGQDLVQTSGWTNAYNLCIAGGNSPTDYGYISFVSHKVNSTTYRWLGGFYDNAGSVQFKVAGNIIATGAVTGGAASDGRLKTNINTLSDEQAKALIMALRPVTFTWNQKATELYDQYKGNDLGFVAQEVENVQNIVPGLSKAIGTIFEDYKRLDPVKFIAPIVKVAQNHETRIQQLERELAQVKNENKQLRNRLNMN